MSLILKGIDMPEPIKDQYTRLELYVRSDGVVFDDDLEEVGQAIQIPTPHGRIGDLDGVIKQIDESPTFASKYKGTARLFIDVYSDSNTILEAEE